MCGVKGIKGPLEAGHSQIEARGGDDQGQGGQGPTATRFPASELRRYVSLGEIMKNKINTFFIVAFVLTLSACAAKQTIPGAERVELVNDLPD